MSDAPLEPVPEDWDRALAVVAHPDDMEYGASAAVARWTAQGKTVTYYLASRGEAGISTMAPERCTEVRAAEQRASCGEVGVSDLRFGDHPDGLITYSLDLRRDIAAVVCDVRPEVVLTISFDDRWPSGAVNHADHRHVGLALVDAVRDAANPWLFADAGDAWDGVRFVLVSGSPRAGHGVDVTDHVEAGIRSLACHERYLAALPEHAAPDEFIRGIAEAEGPRLGVDAAIAFELIEL